MFYFNNEKKNNVIANYQEYDVTLSMLEWIKLLEELEGEGRREPVSI